MADKSLSSRPIMDLRREVCAGLSGRVLEIGFGSGLNLSAYPAVVDSVDAVEPSDTGWELSSGRRATASVPVDRVGLDGQRLAAADATYDAAVSTFTLCTIPDATTALAEVRRVLRPGGTLHVLEHGLAPDARVAAWQHRLDGLQGRIAAGCHLTRDAPVLVEDAGFRVERLDRAYLPGPSLSKPWTFVSLVVAVRP
jgi:SAM-dependent methyltransferase